MIPVKKKLVRMINIKLKMRILQLFKYLNKGLYGFKNQWYGNADANKNYTIQNIELNTSVL